MTLLELAEKVERASANDAELFEDAFRECSPKPKRIWITDNTGDWTPEYSDWQQRQSAFYEFLEAGAFLDAAMSLVPDDCIYLLTNTAIGGHKADLTRSTAVCGLPNEIDEKPCVAATPALALTAASLRARAIEEQSK